MAQSATVVLDHDDMRRTLVRIAHEVVEKNRGGEIALVGIHRRGAALAQRLHALASELLDTGVPLGFVDISFYRDDLAIRPPSAPIVDWHGLSGLRVCLGGVEDIDELELALKVVAEAVGGAGDQLARAMM